MRVAYECVKSLFYQHSISKYGERNILSFELVLFHLKHKDLTKQLPITDLFGKKGDVHVGMNVTFYLFEFHGPKWKIYNCDFFCFLVLLMHFNGLPHISFFFCGS